jgi:hypothetical protein
VGVFRHSPSINITKITEILLRVVLITLDPNPGLTVIKLSSTIFIVILQNYPIRTKYLFDAVL